MKSKLVVSSLACMSILACATWWTGCSSSSDSGDTKEGGTTSETGSSEGGADTSTATDAPADVKPDTSVSGPFVDIQYGTCPTFAKCDSSPVGTWKINGGCVDDSVFDELKTQAMCPTLTVSDVKFQARGTVVADATTIARSTELKFSAKLLVPSGCQNGQSCANIGAALTLLAGLDTATCVDTVPAGEGCNCNVADQQKDSVAAESYTKSGGVLTTGAGSTARTFDYCVASNKFTYRETTAKAPIPATITMAP